MSLRIGRWLVFFAAFVCVALVGLFSVAAQTAPPIFATNTPHGGSLNPTAGGTQPWYNDFLTQGANGTATRTPAPRATAAPVNESGVTRTFYTLGRANVRECARLDCAVIVQLGAGEVVAVTGETSGESVADGDSLWYQVDDDGQVGYIYGELLSATAPAESSGTSASQSVSPVGQVGQSSGASRRSLLTCNRQDNLSCSDFANVAQAQFHLNMCGDEDNIDTDDDGFACEASQP